jgi:iron(III) transport system ATP-binding protein
MLKVENLRKQYVTEDGTPGGGVFGANFEVAEGELFTLLGPSGCGKTTTLRSIAGLEEPDTGKVALAGQDIFNSDTNLTVPSYERDIGMVFQSYAIWPHMSVFENAAYPLKVSRSKTYSKAEIMEKVRTILRMVGMEEYIDRPSTQLSGGQQQRLALARALTREPKLLLLDEPLSNLDAQLREQMRSELQRLQREWGVTSIYVTHDQSEALAISDRIAVMNMGHIIQLGPPKEIYNRPTSEFVANFIGKTNLLHGDVSGDAAKDAMAKVMTPLGELVCYFTAAIPQGKNMAVVIRPENIHLIGPKETAPEDLSPENRTTGKIVHEVYLGEIVEYTVDLGNGIEVFVRQAPGRNIGVNDDVTVCFPPDNTIALIED